MANLKTKGYVLIAPTPKRTKGIHFSLQHRKRNSHAGNAVVLFNLVPQMRGQS